MNDPLVPFDDELGELMDTAYSMEHGPTKISLMEEVVRRADMTGELELQYDTRTMLIEAAVFGGRHDIALVAFTWCLAQSDAHPGEFDEFDLLWKYKWIADSLPNFSSITRAQITGALADMARRYEGAGFSLQPVEAARWKCALYMGELEEARAAYERCAKMKRDASSDCTACVYNAAVEYYGTLGDFKKSVKSAEKILAGKASCAEVPHMTHGHLLWPMFQLGMLEEAMTSHRKGYPMIRRNPVFVQGFAEHLMFLALTANHTKAMQLLGTHLATALEHPGARARFDFLRSALFALLCAQAKGKETIKLRLPASIEFAKTEGVYQLDELFLRFEKTAGELADQLDARNENGYFRGRLQELPNLLAQVRPHSATKKDATEIASDSSA
jgi:tetratricopeptide (TPR) repeat protein